MSTSVYFCWHDHIRIVYGARRAALYDFNSGNVYSLNEFACSVIKQAVTGYPVHAMEPASYTFLMQLVHMQMGYFGSVPRDLPEDFSKAPPVPSLDFLWLELTDVCNLRCIHCYANAGPDNACGCSKRAQAKHQTISLLEDTQYSPFITPTQQLDVENWEKVIHEAALLGCKQIQLIGGEPLLYQALFRLIDTAIHAKYEHIEVFTNGTLLTERHIRAFAERKVRVAVSLHGSTPETQDLVTQQPGSFGKVLHGLELLQQYRVLTRVATTALQSNQNEIHAIKEFAHQYGISYLSYDVVRTVGRGNDQNLLPTDHKVYEGKWLSKPEFVTSRKSYYRNQWWHPCWAGRLAVTKNGDVIPCVFGREQVVGNVLSNSLEQILSGERLHTMWGLTKDQIDICRDCEYRYACGDCRPAALGETGDLYAKYPRCTYDPYQGEWQSVAEFLGLSENKHCKYQFETNQTPPTALQESIPELTLVTDYQISLDERFQMYACDPK